MPSCVGCKFLYEKQEGYSNYTVEETRAHCLLDLNPKLPADRPWDWPEDDDPEHDLWHTTRDGRCSHYGRGTFVQLDVDHERSYKDFDLHPDVEAIWFAKEKLSDV